MEEKIRHCVWCEEEFIRIKGTNSQYCSKECYTKKAYENNKNPVGYMSGTVGVHELGAKRAEKKPKVVDLKQYVTAEEKVAKLEREQQNYTVWEEDDD